MSYLQVGIQIVFMFFLLVTLHEWGHFFFAKRAGILVREFAIGFGPKLFSYKKGETTYTLRILPIGGYVRMAGEDPEIVQINPGQTVGLRVNDGQVTHLFLDQLELRANTVQGEVESIDLDRDLYVRLLVDGEAVRFPVQPQAIMITRGRETQIAPWNRQFGSKKVWQRALSIVAGPAMNFVLAFVLFLAFMVLSGVPTNVKLGKVESGSPAQQADLKAGDIIVEVNRQAIGSDRNLLTSLIRESKDKPMTWIVERDNQMVQKTVTPKETPQGAIMVGIGIDFDKRAVTPREAVAGAWHNTAFATEQILKGFKQLVIGQFKMEDLGGPVRIVEVSGQYAQAGIGPMAFWSAVLSLYLGLFNLLPIPALDGSRLVFLGIEAVRGRPVDPSRESMVHFIGFAMLMLLMIAVTYNDILRLIKG